MKFSDGDLEVYMHDQYNWSNEAIKLLIQDLQEARKELKKIAENKIEYGNVGLPPEAFSPQNCYAYLRLDKYDALKQELVDLRQELDAVYGELEEANKEDDDYPPVNSETVSQLRMELKWAYQALDDQKVKTEKVRESQNKCNIRAQQAEAKVIKLNKELQLKDRQIKNIKDKSDAYQNAAIKLRDLAMSIGFEPTSDKFLIAKFESKFIESIKKTEWLVKKNG